MSEMIDRIARAIQPAILGEGGWKAAARLALEALREPTESMLNAAEAAASWENELDERKQASAAWAAMIDAALKNDAPPS